jgi:ABC-type uncharacterized transport system permease subunit
VTTDDHTALRCLVLGVGMTVLFAAMLFLSPPARASVLCTNVANKDVLAHLEESSKETIRFVGAISTGGTPIPIEMTVAADGSWTILMLTDAGICFMAVGTNWQAVEAKPAGVEN